MVPETDEEWPKCVTGEHHKNNVDGTQHISGPICEPPPPVPFEGKVTLNVTEREVDKVKTCKVTVAQFAQMKFEICSDEI